MFFIDRRFLILRAALLLALMGGMLGVPPARADALAAEIASRDESFQTNRNEFSAASPLDNDVLVIKGQDSTLFAQNNAALIFEPYVNLPVGGGYAVGLGDFNTDGLRDVAMTTSTQLMIFLQNSDGSLADPAAYAAGSRPESLAVGDLNNDGRADIVVTNYTGNTISVFLQELNGTFASRVTYPTNSGPDSVAVGDITGDGLVDIVISHWTAADIGVYTQSASGGLNPMVTYVSPQAGRDDLAIADINNDGRNDVIKMNGQGFNPSLSVYRQNTNGTLETADSYSVTNCSPFCLSHGLGTGDVTGDGLTDIVVSYGGNISTSKIAVFSQAQDGSLQAPVAYPAYDLPEPVEVSDVNQDGLADVLVAHSGWNALSIFTQNNDELLNPYSLYTIPSGHYKPQGLAVGDINQDNLPDVAIADDSNGLVLLYQTLTPPSTPTPTATPTTTATPTITATPSSTPTQTSTPPLVAVSGNTGTGLTALYFSYGGSTTSDENGNYSFTVPLGWTGQVYPSKPGYRFTPSYLSYSNLQTDLQDQDFIAERVYTISGNAGISGAILSYVEDGVARTALSLSNGYYSFQVPEHWSGTVVPARTDYIFVPDSKSYSDVQADQLLQDYTAIQTIFTISGNVRHSGVTLSYVEGDVLKTVTSGSGGNYSLKVNAGWSGTITPTKPGVIFDPVSKTYQNVQSNLTAQNYKASIPVTTLADSGSGSLRNAIASAAYGDMITFHPDLAGQTITLASTLGIGKGLTIDGSGLEPRVEISGNGTVQIFGVNPRLDPSGPPDVKFKSLVLKDGRRAIGIGGGNTLIENVSFINNSAYDGGAISSCCYNTSITITNSEFTSNSAQHVGGAIASQFGSLTIQGSTFINNSAGSVGGAISVEREGPYTFQENTFLNNTGLSGGAIGFESIESPVMVRRNLFSENTASLNGGAMFVLFADSTFTIENNTFYANEASDKGGALVIADRATLRNNTFSDNKAGSQGGSSVFLGTAYLFNNILANSTGGGECVSNGYGAVLGSHNLIEGGAANCPAALTGDPLLGALANHGGSTETMALLPGSPAIDAGQAGECPLTDQRQVARPQGSGCDLGAFEHISAPTATPTIAPTHTPTNTFTPTATPPYSYNPLYLSLTSSQTVGGVASADEDILRFDGKSWSLFFDGSDVGVGSPDLSAFSIIDADSILMSFSANVTVNGITATPQDVLRFDASSLGSATSGTWSLYFDGSDVSLADATNEKIDSLKLLPDGRLLISTNGNPSVPGATAARDEDVLAFTPTSLGNTTSGAWSMYFDGSDVGLSESSGEDVDALDVVGNTIYLSAQDLFSVNGIAGEDDDVFVCAATSTGDTTACNYSPSLYFDGSTWGLTANDVDAFNFLTLLPTPTPIPSVTSTATPTQTPTATATPTNTPLSSPRSVRVLQPNGGEVLNVGSTYRITWNSTADIDTVAIAFTTCDMCLNWITSGLPNKGYYDWDVFVGNTGITQYKIYVIGYDTGVGSASDISDNSFTIVQPTATPTRTATPTLTMTPTATATLTRTPTVVVTTTPSTSTFTAIADTYVNAGSPTTNYGTSTTLRADASPDLHSYLRFNVQGLTGNVTRATLRVFANSASSSGVGVSGVSNNTWTETGINYNNAPPLGSSLGSVASFGAGAWISIDMTAHITGNGTYNLALTTPGSTAVSLASRESGGNAPQLIVEAVP